MVESEQLDGEAVELVARRVHEAWARLRATQGWQYGPVRDDGGKRHPGLVPYDELPEAEKEYDRNTARKTINALRELGYLIGKDHSHHEK